MNEIERAIAEINAAQEPNRCVSLVSGVRISKEWISVSVLELAETVLRAELARQDAKPLTWNERINQMTVDEKAEFLTTNVQIDCEGFCKAHKIGCDNECKRHMAEFLNSRAEVEK